MVTRLRHYWRTHKPSGGWGQVILAPAEFGKSHRQKLWSYSRGREFVLEPVLEIKIGFPDNIIPLICTIHPWSDGTCAHSSAPSRASTMCEHGEAPCWIGNCHQLWIIFSGMGMLVNSPTKSGFCWTAAGFEAFFCRRHLNYPREHGDVSHLRREDY